MQTITLYYQTFKKNYLSSIQWGLCPGADININIIISAIHFGVDKDKKPYIHLNNHPPSSFTDLWEDVQKAFITNKQLNISLMIGGAGGAYSTLLDSTKVVPVYYQLLKDTLKRYAFISSVDLDVEEPCKLEGITALCDMLKKDFPQLKLTFAPVAATLMYNSPGMGGFYYKDLLKSVRVSSLHVQMYNDFSNTAYSQIVKNQYTNLVLGMECQQYAMGRTAIMAQIKQMNRPRGVFIWELGTLESPTKWIQDMYQCLQQQQKEKKAYCTLL